MTHKDTTMLERKPVIKFFPVPAVPQELLDHVAKCEAQLRAATGIDHVLNEGEGK